MSRRRLVALGAVGLVLVVGGAGLAWSAGLLPVGASAASSPGPSDGRAAVTTAAIERRTLQVTADLDGTLGYDGTEEVAGDLPGTVTWLPAEGAVIDRGGRLYEVDGSARSILLLGSRPAWRTLGAGVSDGADVRQLEENLRKLGVASRNMKVDRHWDSRTTAAVKRLQRRSGMHVDGVLGLGEVVFLPSAIRVTERPASLGARVGVGSPVLRGSTTSRVVTVALAADDQALLTPGAAVSVELPDGSTTPAHVASVGRVAHAGEDTGFPGGSTPATIDVTISLDDPAAAGTLDQAPVTVHVVSDAHPDVLAVPVLILVALLEGGYAVEVQAADGSTRYVGVKLGLFQDGWVEITGEGLQPGDRVVVAS